MRDDGQYGKILENCAAFVREKDRRLSLSEGWARGYSATNFKRTLDTKQGNTLDGGADISRCLEQRKKGRSA